MKLVKYYGWEQFFEKEVSRPCGINSIRHHLAVSRVVSAVGWQESSSNSVGCLC
jgi:hypothetical protein